MTGPVRRIATALVAIAAFCTTTITPAAAGVSEAFCNIKSSPQVGKNVAWVVRDRGPAGGGGTYVWVTNCRTGVGELARTTAVKTLPTVWKHEATMYDYTTAKNRMCMTKDHGSYSTVSASRKKRSYITAVGKNATGDTVLVFEFTRTPTNFEPKQFGEVVWVSENAKPTAWSKTVGCKTK